jgi:DNA-binding transcriptional LysR family regulator
MLARRRPCVSCIPRMVTMRTMVDWDADPDLLRTFLAVRRHGNLTRAADELLLSQPAVSRRIDRLEKSLGLELFERLGKSLHLTDAGEALAGEAASLIGAAGRLAEVVRARRAGEEGRLRVGASTTPGLYLLPEALLRFRARFPRVEVHFEVENSRRIEERIIRNDLDLGFVGAHLTHAALRLRVLLRDRIVFYVADTHALARKRTLSPRDLVPEVGIVREPGSATRRLADLWLRRSRAHPQRTLEIRCPEAAKVLVRAGLGFSYMSASGLTGAGGAGLSVLPFDGPRLERPIFVVRHADKRESSTMDAFLRTVAAHVGVSAPSDPGRPRRPTSPVR